MNLGLGGHRIPLLWKTLLAVQSLVILLLLTCDGVNGSPNVFYYVITYDLFRNKKADRTFGGPSNYHGVTEDVSKSERKEVEDTYNSLRMSLDPPGSDILYAPWTAQQTMFSGNYAFRCDSTWGAVSTMFVATTNKVSFKEALLLIRAKSFAYFKSGKCKVGEYHRQCLFYQNLVSPNPFEVGCARAFCFDVEREYRTYCISNGRSGVNFHGVPYKTGIPCQRCPIKKGYCYNNLCISNKWKANVLKLDPTAVITCNVPCMNCGVRKEINGICSCHCPKGYESEVDCSVGTGPLTCSACQRKGTPCQNGGRDADGPNAPCRCLCSGDYTGAHCEIPIAKVAGGVRVPIEGPKVCADGQCIFRIPTLADIAKLVDDLKRSLADEVNKFCKKNQENYIKCCGVGNTLPTTGPDDFVDSANVHVPVPVQIDDQGRLIATPYITVRGDNGLCRKITTKPPPMVPVPPEVLKEVVDQKLADKKPACCDVTVKPTLDLLKTGSATRKVNCIAVQVG